MNENLMRNAAFRRDLKRALANFRFERNGAGLYIPGPAAHVGGVFMHTLNGRDPMVDPNLVVNEGLNEMLDSWLSAGTQVTVRYGGLFSGNATPTSGWTGANWVANGTEFTAYEAATRVAWGEGGPASQSITNASPMNFVYSAGGPYTIYGAVLAEASAKSAITGKLAAATRFATTRTNQIAGDTLGITYTFTASSA